MKDFTLTAAELYHNSKSQFYRLIPQCIVDFAADSSYTEVDLRAVAHEQTKTKRRKLMVLILAYCDEDNIRRFKEWLTEYFSSEMQHEIFELAVTFDGEIKFDEMLERALIKIRKAN